MREQQGCVGSRDWKRQLHRLRNSPNAARSPPKTALKVRHLLYGRRPHVYRVIFTIEADRVVILRIWHGRRHPPGDPH